MAKINFSVGAVTDVGLQRVNNEDNLFIPGIKIKEKDVKVYSLHKENPNGLRFEGGNTLFAVCDGMGGHNAGEYASHMAVSAVERAYEKLVSEEADGRIKSGIDKFLVDVNRQICQVSSQEPDKAGMGCTFCGLYFYGGNRVMPINVGDSRIYMVKGSKLIQLSIDHTDSSVGKGALTRYLGLPEEFGEITAEFGDKTEVLRSETRFLLCTDGLTDMVKNEDILFHLKNEKEPSIAAEKLVDIAKRMGGDDNITVVVIDAKPRGKVFSRMLRKPISYIVASSAVLAAVGGYALFASYNSAVNSVREGEPLAEYNENLINAGTAEEIIVGLESKLSAVENNLKVYTAVQSDCENAGINKIDEYKEAYASLSNSIYTLSEEIVNIQTQLDEIKGIKKDNGTEKLARAEELSKAASILDEKQLSVESASKEAQNAARRKRQADAAEDAGRRKPAKTNSGGGGGKTSEGGVKASDSGAPVSEGSAPSNIPSSSEGIGD